MARITLILLSLAGITAASTNSDQHEVRVCVVTKPQAKSVQSAQRLAAKILLQAGVKLVWTIHPDCAPGSIRMFFAEKSRLPDLPKALALSYLDSRRVTVLRDRIRDLGYPDREVPLLGHVMAHEIVHVLQGVKRHSEEGLMRAWFEKPDIRDMGRQPLTLLPIDIEHIRTGLRPQTDLSPATLE